MPKRLLLAALAWSGAFAGASAAPSQTAPDLAPAAVRAFQVCRAIAPDADRLACFDKAADALQAAQAKGDVVVIDRSKAREIRREAFGFSLPTLSLFERGDPTPNRANFTLTGASQDGAGRWRLATADGGMWQQTDDAILNHEPKPGGVLVARKASLGSYFCKLPGELEVRCRRVG